MPHTSRKLRIVLGSVLAGLAAAVAIAAPAHAGVLVRTATNCEAQIFEQPFLPWADPANYVLAPDGTFENSPDGWALSGGASAVAGNESFHVHGAGESISLALPPGSAATSASMCVGIEHPTIRIFTRNTGGPLATLKVEVLFEDAAGTAHALTIGQLAAGPDWQPSVQMPVVANLLPLLPGERTAVAFRFSAQGAAGAWQIDDVYVDPYRSR